MIVIMPENNVWKSLSTGDDELFRLKIELEAHEVDKDKYRVK